MVERARAVTWIGALNVLLGLVVLATPAFYVLEAGMWWFHVIAGLLIAILAGYNTWAASQGRTDKAFGPGVVNVILGIAVIAAPWVFGADASSHVTLDGVVGVLLVALAGYNAYAASEQRKEVAGAVTAE